MEQTIPGGPTDAAPDESLFWTSDNTVDVSDTEAALFCALVLTRWLKGLSGDDPHSDDAAKYIDRGVEILLTRVLERP